jgi:hypothetical protein
MDAGARTLSQLEDGRCLRLGIRAYNFFINGVTLKLGPSIVASKLPGVLALAVALGQAYLNLLYPARFYERFPEMVFDDFQSGRRSECVRSGMIY